MKHMIKLTMLLAAVALVGCSEEKSRDFFSAGGITIGAPSALGGGAYRIPIEFETQIVHSGQSIDEVSTTVTGSDILFTASFAGPPPKGGYPGHIEVKGVSAGTYTLKYRDPDGTDHTIGPVVLP
jgi:hypothetical protein